MSIACTTVPSYPDSLLLVFPLHSTPLLTSQTCNGLPTESDPLGYLLQLDVYVVCTPTIIPQGRKKRSSLGLHPYFALHLK